ncbi:hypothetical protein LSH36_202g09011 [Paralvinella palmiformis]|uniref:Sulfotransferase n=1 Tax=Paralvinella palmiformis TaxID=53620 RepID=A0AAD9JPC5_9ANNE|nr:hypothetical protein LSH36_202g09011 [Paralvinella palmiformis]
MVEFTCDLGFVNDPGDPGSPPVYNDTCNTHFMVLPNPEPQPQEPSQAGVEPWVIAVAVIIPLVVLGAAGGGAYAYVKRSTPLSGIRPYPGSNMAYGSRPTGPNGPQRYQNTAMIAGMPVATPPGSNSDQNKRRDRDSPGYGDLGVRHFSSTNSGLNASSVDTNPDPFIGQRTASRSSLDAAPRYGGSQGSLGSATRPSGCGIKSLPAKRDVMTRMKRKINLTWQQMDKLMIILMITSSMLSLVALITGICPLGCRFRIQKKDSPPRQTHHQVIVLGYARSGSSYLGHLLGGRRGAFYSYEPLDALYVSLYGTRQGWNCHSDIIYFSNGTERIPNQREVEEVSQYVDNLLNCRTDAFYPEIWLHGFWQKFSEYHFWLRPFTGCLWKNRVDHGNFLRCQNHLLGKCQQRLNWAGIAGNERCPTGILNKQSGRTGVAYQRYTACIGRLEHAVYPCRKYFTESCERSSLRVAKTVRMTMEATEKLLRSNPDLRIVHLIRDPRAVVFSRARFDPSVHGLYSGSPMNHVKEATAYCSIVRRDISKRKRLELLYPGAFMEVLYEELIADPEALVERIHDFIGVSFEAERRNWLKRTMLAWSGDPKRWRTELPPHIIRTVDRVCEGLYKYIPYNVDYPKH